MWRERELGFHVCSVDDEAKLCKTWRNEMVKRNGGAAVVLKMGLIDVVISGQAHGQ